MSIQSSNRCLELASKAHVPSQAQKPTTEACGPVKMVRTFPYLLFPLRTWHQVIYSISEREISPRYKHSNPRLWWLLSFQVTMMHASNCEHPMAKKISQVTIENGGEFLPIILPNTSICEFFFLKKKLSLRPDPTSRTLLSKRFHRLY